jgi:hypothetical protein
MKISEMKEALPGLAAINFKLPDGAYLPAHFHVTEVGLVTKHFIDCGGVERRETVANFQLWEAGDYDHRLAPQKFLGARIWTSRWNTSRRRLASSAWHSTERISC